MHILIVGATGVLGKETTRQLLAAGHTVRAMTRDPQKAVPLKEMGAEVVQGDLIDVASLKKHLATLEDRLLEAMLMTESAASSLTEARAALSDVESNLGDQTRNLTAERATLAHALERLDAERKAAASPVNTTLFEQYETLRRERRGIAVTTVSDGACDACGTTLTPAQQQTARSSAQIARCPTCGRILFAD